MNDYMADFLERDVVRVAWVELGEGWSGDYNPDDPDDEELLRFDVYIKASEASQSENWWWEQIEDASYCTRFPASATPEQRAKGLEIIMDAVYERAMEGESIKKLCERLSWIGLNWLEEDKDE